MIKNIHKIAVCMLLGITLSSTTAYSNDLTQLDIKRSTVSPSTINVTIYTSSPYDDNVAVAKKDDNKYVIIMPNVLGAASTKPDLSGLQDIVSDIDVKSVQDDGNGYTKVTLITTKPVTIKTTAKKSTPLTEEQKAYKNLIAQSRVNKPLSNTNTGATTPTTIKFEASKSETVNNQAKAHTDTINTSNIAKVDQTKKNTGNIMQTAGNKIKTTVKTVMNEKPVNANQNKSLQTGAASKLDSNSGSDVKPKENTSADKVNKTVSSADNTKSKKTLLLNSLIIFVLLLNSVLGVFLLLKLIKKFLKNTSVLKMSFKENLSNKPVETETCDNIVNNPDMSWQEKYQAYINSMNSENTARRVLKHVGNGEYRFINEIEPESHKPVKEEKIQKGFSDGSDDTSIGSAQLKPKKVNKFKSYNKPAKNLSPENIPPIKKVKNQDLISQKVPKLQIVEENYKDLEESLERTLRQTPDIEQFNITEDDILKQLKNNFKTPSALNEADKIAGTMRETKKLKSFANKIALEETKRELPLPKTRSEIRRTGNIESKHVALGSSSLHTNPRRFEGANLSVGDLIAKSSRLLNIPAENASGKPAVPKKSCSTVTPDEFFDKANPSNSLTASTSLAGRVADGLGKMTVEADLEKIHEQNKADSNPFKDIIILSGYRIGNDSGFYVIKDSAGKISLAGIINNNITVLKNLDGMSDIKLQVRVDSPNVYMVKVNGCRCLVEINNNKMGVLLEL